MSSDVGAPACDPAPAEAAIASRKRTRDPSAKFHREVAAVQRLMKRAKTNAAKAGMELYVAAIAPTGIGASEMQTYMEVTPGLKPMIQKTGEAFLRGMVAARHVGACNADLAAKLPHAIDAAKRPELSLMCRGWQLILCPEVSCDSHRAAAVGSTGGGADASGTAAISESAAEAAPDDEEQPLSSSSPGAESGTTGPGSSDEASSALAVEDQIRTPVDGPAERADTEQLDLATAETSKQFAFTRRHHTVHV